MEILPTTGRFLPEQALSEFDGENPSGLWSLEVIDDNATDIGTLLNWGIEVETVGLAPLVVNLSSNDTTEAIPVLEGSFDSIGSVAIIDGDTAMSQIEVPAGLASASIANLDLTLSLSHEDISDLDVYLVSPSGARIQLFNEVGVGVTGLDGALINHESPASITTVTSPGQGQYRPLGDLSSLYGGNPSGIWTLEVTDKTDSREDPEADPITVGTIQGWSLSVYTPPRTNEITIPANQSQVVIPLAAIDDNILDGTQSVTIGVTDVVVTDNHGSFFLESDVVDVTDAEQILISLNSHVLSEAADNPATLATITRSDTSSDTDLVVNLSSSDSSELTVPATVIIPANASSATFNVSVIDDQLFDGDQIVTISASVGGFLTSVSDPITVQDKEPRLRLSTVTTGRR